jgi:hypothetical protein
MKRYPAIEIVAVHGRRIAAAIGAVVAVAALISFARAPQWETLVYGVLAAALAFPLLRVAAEIVEVVADTLLPK